jgi:hypothetical protein
LPFRRGSLPPAAPERFYHGHSLLDHGVKGLLAACLEPRDGGGSLQRLSALPVLVASWLPTKQFIRGLSAGALKG